MQLTDTQKQDFIENGFVQLPGVVPRAMVNAALRAINHSVGQGMKPEDMATMRAQTYCRELTGTPLISDLFNATPLRSLAESAIGEGNLKPVGGGQIALRFPSLQDPPGRPHPHLDGISSPNNNGVPEGTLATFTALASVLLGDLPDEFAGNFTVWPGTHRLYEEYFREHGSDALLKGMPPLELPAPRQITGRAGDAVLCHYQLAHGVAPNVSPHVRYAVFFRLKHRDHDSHPKDAMTDIWMDWPALRQAKQ